MRYLYTTTPDEGCREVAEGIYGRPVHTDDQPKLLAKGWKKAPDELRKEETKHVRYEEEAQAEEVTDELIYAYKEKFGKRPHHKMKVETILQKLEESDD